MIPGVGVLGKKAIPEINIACPTITPVLGDEMWDAAAAAFTSGTYAWAAAGSNTIENDTNTLKISYVDNSNGASVNLNDAADLNANLAVGTIYKIGFDLKAGASTAVAPLLYDGKYYPSCESYGTTSFNTKHLIFRAYHATSCFFSIRSMAAGETCFVDNLSLKPVNNTSVLLGTLSHQTGTYICHPTVETDSAAGLILAYKDSSNYLLMMVDNTIPAAQLWKIASGTWTRVITGSISYAGGGELKLIISGMDCSLYYAGTQVGSTTAVAELVTMGMSVYGWNNLSGNEVGAVTTSLL